MKIAQKKRQAKVSGQVVKEKGTISLEIVNKICNIII